jgi:tetratricopeptide (TPR) repeat protein
VKIINRLARAGVLLAAAVALVPVSAAASSSGMSTPSPPPSPGRMITPEEMARDAYNSGIDHKDKGLKLEQKAADVQAKDREKNAAKSRSEYEKALKDFKKAAELAPDLFQAYNGMGFAYRKTGDYTKALEMYDKALKLSPGFSDAIEYRGEAYLALNRIDDAKQAYLELFARDRKQATLLMRAMTDWIERRKADPAGVDPAAVSSFESWVKERSTLAGQTAQMALNVPHASWR